MNEQKNLNYIAGLIIQAFRKTGLDEAYIDDKRYQFLEHENKYESLLWAINQLDETRTRAFCELLGVTELELQQAKRVKQQAVNDAQLDLFAVA